MTCVDPLLHAFPSFDITLSSGEIFQARFEPLQRTFRQAVCQVKGHVLRRFGTFEVREISTTSPFLPAKSDLPICLFPPANREIGAPGIPAYVDHEAPREVAPISDG